MLISKKMFNIPFCFVDPGGVEPPTSSLQMKRSTG